MIEILKLDISNTDYFYKKMKNQLDKGACYNNTLNLVVQYLLPQFQLDIIKIGYCYIGGSNHQYVRHCVVITDNNEIIDISSLLRYKTKKNLAKEIKKHDIKYYVFAKLNCKEYADLLSKNKEMPDLKNSLVKHEKEMVQFIINNNLEVNKYDYDKYVLPLLNLEYEGEI